MAFTKIAAAGIGSTELVTLHSLEVLNNATVGGVLTYEDVTNVDSIGIVTARAGVLVGSGITLSKDGDIFATGVTTTGSLVSSGAISGTTGTFSGGTLTVSSVDAGATGPTLKLFHNSASPADNDVVSRISMVGDDDAGNETEYARIDAIAKDVSNTGEDGNLTFSTIQDSSFAERLRIDSAGRVLIGGTSAIIGSEDEFSEIVLTGRTRGAGITLQDTDANTRFQIRTDDAGSDGPQTLLNASTNHPITIRTNNTEVVRITNTGNIGIGTTNPHTISGYTGLTLNHITHGGFVQFADNGTNTSRVVGGPNALELNTQTSIPILFKTAGDNVRMSISATGDINIHNTTATSTTDPITVDLGGQFTAAASITQSNLKLKLYNNGSNGDAAGITASAEGLAYVGGHTTGHVFYTVPSSINSLEERLRILSDGKVGINIATPRCLLDLGLGTDDSTISNTAAHYQLGLHAAQSTGGDIGRNIAFISQTVGTVCAAINTIDAGGSDQTALAFYTGTNSAITEKMRIQADGKISMGNPASASPNRLLYIDTGTTGDGMKITSDEVLGDFVVNNTGDGHGRAFVINASRVDSGSLPKLHLAGQGSITLAVDANSTRMTIDSSGNIGAPSGNNIYNASDERLKENMIDLTNGLDKINKLKPVSFTWKNGWSESLDGVTQYGFGAQTTQSVDELLVEPFSTGDVELNGETIENPLRVNEKHIIPLLVKAIQELSAKVAALEG